MSEIDEQSQGQTQTRPRPRPPRRPKDPYAERIERLDINAPRYTEDREIILQARDKIRDLGDVCLSIEIKGKRPDNDDHSRSVWFITATVAKRRDAAQEHEPVMS